MHLVAPSICLFVCALLAEPNILGMVMTITSPINLLLCQGAFVDNLTDAVDRLLIISAQKILSYKIVRQNVSRGADFDFRTYCKT